jgi:hypothetical protein
MTKPDKSDIGAGDRPVLMITISLACVREVIETELAMLFSQFEGASTPRGYEVDHIIGRIVERGTPVQ